LQCPASAARKPWIDLILIASLIIRGVDAIFYKFPVSTSFEKLVERSILNLNEYFIFYVTLMSARFIVIFIIHFISNCLDLTRGIKIAAMQNTLKHRIVASAIRTSFGIYCSRNSAALDTT